VTPTSPTDRPLVSIVTPTLDRAAMLERTLRSVRAQAHPSVEHIIVDGGSTDGTRELLTRYASTYDLRWISEPDRGMYDAVNKGMRMTRGSIVAYLNSDDLYLPWTVETMLAALAEHPNAGIVYGDAIRLDRIAGRVVPVFQAPVRRTLATFGSLIQPAVAMRRQVFEELGGFDAELRYVADLDFWLRAQRRFGLVRVDEFLAVEERHEAMLSVAARDAMAAEDVAMRARHAGRLPRSAPARVAGRAWLHAGLTAEWLRFVLATRGVGPGWARTREVLGPRVSASLAISGLLPSHGGRRRAGVAWRRDVLSVAVGEADGS
jgi:glycosyltransferase involved in cell wall biosynthesis